MYHFDKAGLETSLHDISRNSLSKSHCRYGYKYHCLLNLCNKLPSFSGYGSSKSEARKQHVCQSAYEYLERNDLLFTIRDKIENTNKKDAINQLEVLARRGYFSIPKYNFQQKYDNDGNLFGYVNAILKSMISISKQRDHQKKMQKKKQHIKC